MNVQNITNDKKALIEIYRLFYGSNPNFTDKNINIQIQAMMVILFYFGLPFGNDYGFHFLHSKMMPISFSLQDDIESLFLLGTVNDTKLIKLLECEIRRIETVRNFLFQDVVVDSTIDELIISISKIIYTKEYCLSSKSGILEIADFLKCPIEEVASGLQLVKKIENQFGAMFKNN